MATFRGTVGRDSFAGGGANDLFVFRVADLAPTDRLSGGAGVNLLSLDNTSNGVAVLTDAALRGLSDIAALALSTSGGSGFELRLTDRFFATNREGVVAIGQSGTGDGLNVLASAVTKMRFEIAGTQDAQDVLRTGAGADVLVYYGDSLNINDVLNGGRGDDMLVLSGAGGTVPIKDGGEYVDPNGRSNLADVRNVETVIVTDLDKGQSRLVEFGNLIGTSRYLGGAIEVATNANFGTAKAAAAVAGKLIVNGGSLAATQALSVTGGLAGDEITAGAGADRLAGGAGADTLTGGLGGDRLVGGGGNDVFRIGDTIFGRAAGEFFRDVVSGGAGLDTLAFAPSKSAGPDAVTTLNVTAAAFAANTVTGIEKIAVDLGPRVTSLSLALSKDVLADNHDAAGVLTVTERGGADDRRLTVDAALNADRDVGLRVVVSGSGVEMFKGGAGDDVFDYRGPFPGFDALGVADRIDGRGGADAIHIAVGSVSTLGAGVANVELLKVFADSFGSGETIVELAVRTALTIDGRALDGFESLVVRGQALAADGLTVLDATGRLTVLGGRGADTLIGGLAADTLTGGAGDDAVLGGRGGDQLAGGAGRDVFYYRDATDSTVAAAGRDVIADFSRTQGDRIGFIHVNTPAFDFIDGEAFHRVAGEVRAIVAGGATFVQLDLDGDAATDLQITLRGVHALTAADFLL